MIRREEQTESEVHIMKLTTVEELYKAMGSNPVYGIKDDLIEETIQMVAQRYSRQHLWAAHCGFILGVMMGRRDERQRRRTGKGIFNNRR